MNENDLLQRTITRADSSETIPSLKLLDEDDLYVFLAQSCTSIAEPHFFSSFDKKYDADDLYRDTKTLELGKRVFRRWSRALHQFACASDAEDREIKTKILGALAGKEGGAAIIAGILVSLFGVSPAVAALVATLLTKLIVKPAADEICETWRISLSATDGV